MTVATKNIIATGGSSGLVSPPMPWTQQSSNWTQGFEVVKQLLQKPEPHNFILGVRDTERTRTAYKELAFDESKHSVHIFPLDLSNLRSVQLFAQQALTQLGPNKLDLLFLNAGVLDTASGPGPNGSQWCEGYVVNHLGRLQPRSGTRKFANSTKPSTTWFTSCGKLWLPVSHALWLCPLARSATFETRTLVRTTKHQRIRSSRLIPPSNPRR